MTQQELADERAIQRNILEIQRKVALRCDLSRDWVSRQREKDERGEYQWVGWGAIVGKGYFFIPDADAMHDPNDEAFIDALAEKVMGYPPDSPQHLQRQLDECYEHQQRLGEDFTRISVQIARYSARIRELMNALDAARALAESKQENAE